MLAALLWGPFSPLAAPVPSPCPSCPSHCCPGRTGEHGHRQISFLRQSLLTQDRAPAQGREVPCCLISTQCFSNRPDIGPLAPRGVWRVVPITMKTSLSSEVTQAFICLINRALSGSFEDGAPMLRVFAAWSAPDVCRCLCRRTNRRPPPAPLLRGARLGHRLLTTPSCGQGSPRARSPEGGLDGGHGCGWTRPLGHRLQTQAPVVLLASYNFCICIRCQAGL